MIGQPRPALDALPAYKPGRSIDEALDQHGITSAVKLASNELPFGPLPSVADAVSSGIERLHLYADTRATALRAAISEHHDVDDSRVTVANGSVTLLQRLALSYVDAGEEIAMCWPSFEAYPMFAALVGAKQNRVPLVDERFDLKALAGAVTDQTKIVMIANPNNPTGTTVPTTMIADFCRSVPTSCLVVLDEAYTEFVTEPTVTDSVPLLDEFDHLVVARTFSKAHGLAGLRVGYALAHPEVIGMLDRTQVPFAVNELAQRAAIASLGAIDEMQARVNAVTTERSRVVDSLNEQGWRLPDAQANFVWLPVGPRSLELGAHLESTGVITRVFANVGIRITVGDTAMNDRLLEALAGVDPSG